MDSFGKDDLDNMLKMIARVNSNFSVPAETVGEASYAFRGDPDNRQGAMTIANVSNVSNASNISDFVIPGTSGSYGPLAQASRLEAFDIAVPWHRWEGVEGRSANFKTSDGSFSACVPSDRSDQGFPSLFFDDNLFSFAIRHHRVFFFSGPTRRCMCLLVGVGALRSQNC